MTLNLTLLVLMGVLFAVGIYLLLERSLTRVLLGIILISNAVNLLLLQTGGRAGDSPLVEDGDVSADFFDPLPQALLLTAIVIAFALVSLMLALIYRSWVLARQDEVSDDEEDRRVAAQPVFDPEEDSEVPTETTEFAVEDLESARLLNPRSGRDEDLSEVPGVSGGAAPPTAATPEDATPDATPDAGPDAGSRTDDERGR